MNLKRVRNTSQAYRGSRAPGLIQDSPGAVPKDRDGLPSDDTRSSLIGRRCILAGLINDIMPRSSADRPLNPLWEMCLPERVGG